MQNNSSREEILKRIAAASNERLAFVYTETLETEPIYKPILPDSVTCFVNELEAINGRCILCDNESEMYAKLNEFVLKHGFSSLFCCDINISKKLKELDIPYSNSETEFEEMKAGITFCEFLVARTGSVLISSASPSGRRVNIFPPVHIVLANKSQLVDYLEDALGLIHKKYGDILPSIISTITGPSRTADIEKTLVVGVHGPKEVYLFLVDRS